MSCKGECVNAVPGTRFYHSATCVDNPDYTPKPRCVSPECALVATFQCDENSDIITCYRHTNPLCCKSINPVDPNVYDNMLNPAGFGVFNDEGMVSGPYYTRESAEAAKLKDAPSGESELYVTGVCPDHDDEPHDSCQACNEESDKDEDDDPDYDE